MVRPPLGLDGIFKGRGFLETTSLRGAAPSRGGESASGVLITDESQGARGDHGSLACPVTDIWPILTTNWIPLCVGNPAFYECTPYVGEWPDLPSVTGAR